MEGASHADTCPPHERTDKWSDDMRWTVCELYFNNWSWEDINRVTRVPQRTAQRIVQEWVETGSSAMTVVPPPGGGGAGSIALHGDGVPLLLELLQALPKARLAEHAERMTWLGYPVDRKSVV